MPQVWPKKNLIIIIIIIIYIYTIYRERLLYMNLVVTTNQKPVIDTHYQRENNPNITLKIVIKLQGKRAKEGTQ